MAQPASQTSLQDDAEPTASAQAAATRQQAWICDRYEIKRPLDRDHQCKLSQPASFSPVRTVLAWDHQDQVEVVLKALAFGQLEGWKTFELFEREARALSQLNHPAIPRYLDYIEQRDAAEQSKVGRRAFGDCSEAVSGNGFENGQGATSTFYLVQAYIPGLSLGERVRRGDRFSEDEVRAIARQGLEILSYLHNLNPSLIHRDIKPDNLIYNEEFSSESATENSSLSNGDLASHPQIYLVDFGAAKAVNSSGSTVIGTYGYMAPEQFRGQTSAASDLYSLGATLLNLLTHQDPVALPTHRLHIDFRSVLNLSDDFAQWLDGLLAPVAADRFDSAQQALAALDDPSLTAQLLPPSQALQQAGSIAIAPASSQPPDSPIRLQYRSGCYPLHQASLSLVIPPIGLQRELWALGGFALLWNGGLLYWLIMAWAMDAPWFYPVASAPLWGVGLLILERLSQSFFGQVRFSIDQGRYCLEQRLGPIRRIRQGPLSDWQRAELRQQYRRNSEVVAAIALVIDHEVIEFGGLLSAAEQQWLVNELQAFLSLVQDSNTGNANAQDINQASPQFSSTGSNSVTK